MPNLIASIFVALICNFIYIAAVQADAVFNTSNNSSSDNKSTSVKQIDTEIYSKLKDVADGAHHLQQTLHEIVFEVTRQDYAIASEPNVIGPMVIPAIPMPTGAIPMGIFFPPRKKYMTLYAEHTHSLLTMLTEESASLPNNVENDDAMTSKIANIKQYLEKLRNENDTLQQLMAGPAYNNLLIGKQAVQMSDEIDQIKKLLKDSEKEVHNDLKQTTK